MVKIRVLRFECDLSAGENYGRGLEIGHRKRQQKGKRIITVRAKDKQTVGSEFARWGSNRELLRVRVSQDTTDRAEKIRVRVRVLQDTTDRERRSKKKKKKKKKKTLLVLGKKDD